MKRYGSGAGSWLTGLCLALACPGCATVAGGSRDQKVAINSKPDGAQVFVDGQPAGVTPTQLVLNRNINHEVVIDKPGYVPYRTTVNSGLNPWVFGNLAVGGIIGLAVDITCDSCHQLRPGSVEQNLKPMADNPGPVSMAN
jgi:hypothetical protein